MEPVVETPTTAATLPVIPSWAKRRWIISVDLGQSIDPTAIAVLEVVTRESVFEAFWAAPADVQPTIWEPPRSWYGPDITTGIQSRRLPARIVVRHLNRLRLHMNYVDQVAHIAKLMKLPPFDRVRPELVVDGTGVGRPVLDMFTRARLPFKGVTIVAGKEEKREWKNGYEDHHVAKLILVSRMQMVLHEGILQVANVPDAKTLAQELMDFRGHFGDSGYVRFGAREGAHDDLVLACAIGCWWACREGMTATWGRYYV